MQNTLELLQIGPELLYLVRIEFVRLIRALKIGRVSSLCLQVISSKSITSKKKTLSPILSFVSPFPIFHNEPPQKEQGDKTNLLDEKPRANIHHHPPFARQPAGHIQTGRQRDQQRGALGLAGDARGDGAQALGELRLGGAQLREGGVEML